MRRTSPGSCPPHDGDWTISRVGRSAIDLFASEVACELGDGRPSAGQSPRSKHPRHSAKRGETPHLRTLCQDAGTRQTEPRLVDGDQQLERGLPGQRHRRGVGACRKRLRTKPFYAAAAEQYIANFLVGFHRGRLLQRRYRLLELRLRLLCPSGQHAARGDRRQTESVRNAASAQCRSVRPPHGNHARHVPGIRRLLGRIHSRADGDGLRLSPLRSAAVGLGAARLLRAALVG